jgi:hypothetical protein
MPDDAASDELPADDPHLRPDGVTDAEVDASGKLSEALEWIDRARGRLYDFHQLMGHADLLLDDAVDLLRKASHDDLADRVERELVGRNVLSGRWTFQIVEEFDDTYWEPFRAEERHVREQLVGGRRHVFESEMKEERRTDGRPHHEGRPEPGA